MKANTEPLIAAALAAVLVLSGCIGSQTDNDLAANSAEGNSDVLVSITAENPGDVAHLGLEVDGVFAHDGDVALPDGFHDLTVESDHADLVADGQAASVELASGSIPAGNYDQVLLRLANATAKTNSSGGHDHGGDGGHDHGHGGAATINTGPVDIPLNASFEAVPDETTEVQITVDVDETVDGDSLSPSFASVDIVRGNQTVDTQTSFDTRASTDQDLPDDPPAARLAVFAPNGDQVYKPAFDPESGVFVNSESSAFKPGETVRFGATESEAVAKGASIDRYEWSFGDGSSDTGVTASHAYEKQGVFEVELEVIDSYGNTATHMVRVVILQTEWTTTLVDTSFEDGEGDWTTSSSGSLTPAGEAETTWALDGQGFNSSTSWHVGHHATHPEESGAPTSLYPGYTPNSEATLTSPEFQIPEDWTNAGFSFYVGGTSEACCDPLTITYSVDGGSGGQAAQIYTTNGWTQIEDLKALSGATGKTVQFQFTFTSDTNTEQGPGFYVDDFAIGGVDIPIENAELLEDSGGHDGHDHSH